VKNLIFFSVLTAFISPMALSAEEARPDFFVADYSRIAEGVDFITLGNRCTPEKCTPQKPKCPPKEEPKCATPKPKCPPKEKPKCPPKEKPKCPPKEKPKCPPKEKPKCAAPKPKCPPKKKPRCAPTIPQRSPKKKPVCWEECNPTKWSFQARGAAYLPLQSEIRQIYGSALPTVELETSYQLSESSSCHQFLLFWNVGWTFQTGKTIGFGYHSRLNMIPLSLGLEYQVNICRNVDFYFGAAPTYSFLLVEDKDGFTTSNMYKSQFGATSKTGFRFTFATNFFFDVFGDFYYTPFGKMQDSIQSFNGNFTGFFVGGGFGGKW
jgi:hypothetical protein